MITTAQAEPGAGLSWADFVEEHCRTLAGLAPITQASIRRTLERFDRIIGPASPAAVRFVDLERFVSQIRAEGLRPATINKELRNLHGAFNAAVDREYIVRSPVRRRHFQYVAKKIIRVITPAEELRLLAACPTELWRTFLYALLSTGVRLSQLLPTGWTDFDLGDTPTMRALAQKRGAERLLPLAAETAQRLRLLKIATLPSVGPFQVLRSVSTVQREFRRIVKRAGIKHCTLHDMRRTFCSRLAALGVNQVVVQTLAGHSSPATTARYYQRIEFEIQRAAVERLAADMAG